MVTALLGLGTLLLTFLVALLAGQVAITAGLIDPESGEVPADVGAALVSVIEMLPGALGAVLLFVFGSVAVALVYHWRRDRERAQCEAWLRVYEDAQVDGDGIAGRLRRLWSRLAPSDRERDTYA